MTLLGLVLVLLAGGAVVLVATEETSRYILFGYTLQLDHVQMFAAGAVTAVVLLLGLWMMVAGTRRSARRRRRMRADQAQTSDRVARLEDEKRELEQRLERERAAEHAATDRAAVQHAVADRATADRVAAERGAAREAAGRTAAREAGRADARAAVRDARAAERDEDRDTAPFPRDGADREPAYTQGRTRGPAHARVPGARVPGDRLVARGPEDTLP
ncbi:hypothetical protein GCM10010149_43930 [Nonomuraea roseoviolacea subsp. roseoviolacea]|uniref:LapA family protein n=1 Tax=Nonomuraea roseoviolacea subsp. carminata TaxID=160689 RepID=A0ABT1K002_9ACTN|nr:hypothetical protein [Nonomuraea roseoviolacea]MCP2346959.1 hypothetical protein [Nonomuraea roseoviolacea subsp. carminata]